MDILIVHQVQLHPGEFPGYGPLTNFELRRARAARRGRLDMHVPFFISAFFLCCFFLLRNLR